jgi:hypothetical protein
MPTAIEHIVSVFVALGNRRQLEDMKLQRERDLQGHSGVSVPIRQFENEIAVIDAGLEKLRTAGPAALAEDSGIIGRVVRKVRRSSFTGTAAGDTCQEAEAVTGSQLI